MNIYVNNLSPEIDNFELYNLFKEKYTSVHHASIIKNKGYGIINFLDKEECEKCLKEMNGFLFHNKALEVKEMKKNNNHENNYEKEKSNQSEENSEKSDKEFDEKNDIVKYKFEYNINFISELKGHNGPITSLVCSEDKNGVPLLFSGSEDTSIIVWKLNFKEGTSEKDKYSNQNETIIKSKKIIKKHNNFITSLSLNSDNTQLISSSLDN